MKNQNLAVLGACMLLLFMGCSSRTGDEKTPQGVAIVTRSLPSEARAGENLTVSLTMAVSGSLNAVGIEENYPLGWKVSAIPLKGVPKGGRIEWLFWSMGEPIINRTFNYTVSVPADYSGDAVFAGKVITKGTYAVEGDTSVKVV